MKYMIDKTNFNETAENPGPILFYAGNEGPIEAFYDNSGYITQNLSADFKALVVFAEHRYYGESLPFGDQSLTKDNLKYLKVEYVMEDYIELLDYIKNLYYIG